MGTKDSKDNVKITKGNCNLRIDLQRGMKISGCSSVVELSACRIREEREIAVKRKDEPNAQFQSSLSER